MKRLAHIAAVLLACISMLARAGSAAAEPRQPNIVLIVSDDQAWTDYGFMGHPEIQTPHLDRLAGQGLVFERGYVAAPLCRPSLASIVTGLYPFQHGMTGNDVNGYKERADLDLPLRQTFHQHPSFIKLLSAHGYHTHQSGKWWEGSWLDGGFTAGMTHGDPKRGGRHGDAGLDIGRKTMQPIKDAIDASINEEKPFFIWYAPFLPHSPHNPPQRLLRKYNKPGRAQDVTRYYAMCEWFDETCGELLDYLDEKQVRDNTLILYICDNGWAAASTNADDPHQKLWKAYAQRSKSSPYENGIRTPIMVSWPGHSQPIRAQSLAHAIDIFPTIAAAAGLEVPVDLPGINLLDERARNERQSVFGVCHSVHNMTPGRPDGTLQYLWCVDGDWKLLLRYKGDDTTQYRQLHVWDTAPLRLYNLKRDPHEKNELSASHPEIVDRLRQKIEAWHRVVDPPAASLNAPPESADESQTQQANLESRPPNIVIILADDLAWADVGCYGSTFHETPNLDRLAGEGMRFTNGYAAHMSCSPSRAALLTGRYPARLNITAFIPGPNLSGKFLPAKMRMELPFEEVTLAEALKPAGYATLFVGKWHLGDAPFMPERQGFDVNVGGNRSGAPGSYFWPYGRGKKTQNYHGIEVPGLYEGGHEGEHLCDRLTTEALKLIAAHQEKPFFLYLPFYDVHTPIQAKPELIQKYREKARRLGLPEEATYVSDGTAARGTRAGLRQNRSRQVQNDPAYAAMVETMDTNVGRVLDELIRLGLDRNTVVLFTSDNGGYPPITSNLPFRGGKGWAYEGGTREPWLVKWPGVTRPGSTCDVPVIFTDVFPTALEMAGLPPMPELHCDGVSLAPLLKGENKSLHDALFWHYPHYAAYGCGPYTSIRRDEWKLIEWLEDGSVDLFNLVVDPGEQHNLADTMPDIVEELRSRIHHWRRSVNANMPRPR